MHKRVPSPQIFHIVYVHHLRPFETCYKQKKETDVELGDNLFHLCGRKKRSPKEGQCCVAALYCGARSPNTAPPSRGYKFFEDMYPKHVSPATIRQL